MRSKAPPLTTRCLSPLPGFESRPGIVRKLPVTWGLTVIFAGCSGFLNYLQLAIHELATIDINVTKNEIPNISTIITSTTNIISTTTKTTTTTSTNTTTTTTTSTKLTYYGNEIFSIQIKEV